MWKIALGFVAFAALAMYVIMQGGDKLDMAGEQHGTPPAQESAASASK